MRSAGSRSSLFEAGGGLFEKQLSAKRPKINFWPKVTKAKRMFMHLTEVQTLGTPSIMLFLEINSGFLRYVI